MRKQPAAVVVFALVTAAAGLAALAPAQRPAREAATQPAPGGAERRLTAAHLLALRNGGEVRLAPGTYTSRTAAEIRGASGFALLGEGVTIRAPLRIVDCHDFRIAGVTFDGARAAIGVDMKTPTLRVTGCSGFTIENCLFKGARVDHLYFESQCHGGLIANCRFEDAWRNAISVINGHHLRFQNNTIDKVLGEVLGAGIDIEGNPGPDDFDGCNHDITVVGNTFRDCAETGVRITNGREPYRIEVLDNTFENCPTGVLVGGRDCRVRGNVFRDAAKPQGAIGDAVRAQVYLNGTVAGGLTEVTGNRFERLDGMGAVRVHPTWRGPVLVTGNVIRGIKGSRTNAISVYSADAVVAGNTILDVESIAGISISAAGATVTGNVLIGGGTAGATAIGSNADGGWYSGNRVSAWPTQHAVPKGNELK